MTINIGSTAPNFVQNSTLGPIDFYEWSAQSWVVLFSHPKNFTPVCTTEIGSAAALQEQFSARGAKVMGLTVDSAGSHGDWIADINRIYNTDVRFPILIDNDRKVARLYGMLPNNADDAVTVRSVFIIDPQKKVRLTLTYPHEVGRNFNELLRAFDALRAAEDHQLAAPANWQIGEELVIPTRIQDPEELSQLFPDGYRTVTPYLRFTRPAVRG
ncbi:peroxiredoxin [Bradyrhizobium sp.]|uniref:peroxiredoxin n=1 Tax=Bradyrhizobium sp. TaxID=376 RepID=UPI0039E53CD4